MPHANAPLTPAGRLRLVRRCEQRPIAHVAAEASVSPQCLAKWVARYRTDGEPGLADRSSRPRSSPTATAPAVIDRITAMRKRKWSARRITRELAGEGIPIAVCTVSRILRRHGLHLLDWLDVDGQPLRAPGRITARYPGLSVRVKAPLLRWLDPEHLVSGSYPGCRLRVDEHAFCRRQV